MTEFPIPNCIFQDEAAHNKLPHLDLSCLSASLQNINLIWPGRNFSENFADINFVVCVFGSLILH